MRYWQLFWTGSLLVAGVSFTMITLVVAIRGFGDLRRMLADLTADRKPE